MKKLILLLIINFFQISFAQTAEQIIAKNIQKTGGLIQWKLLNSIMLEGKVFFGVSEEYSVKIFQQRPNFKKTIFVIKGKEYPIEGFDGEKGYSMNFATNKLVEIKDYLAESFDSDFIDYDSKGFVANYLGKEKIGNVDCYKVELVKNVNKTIYYFDTVTYMLVREINKMDIITYYDYRNIGNLLMPFRIESSSQKKEGDYILLFNKIEVNKVLPENIFKFIKK